MEVPAAQGIAAQLRLIVIANRPSPSTEPATQNEITGLRP